MNAAHEIIKAMQDLDQGKRVRVASDHDEALKHALSQGKPGDWASNHREEARSYTGYNYVCIESLASQVAQAEVMAYRSPSGKRKSIAGKQEGDPLDEDHPLYDILNRPNPTQSGSSFRYEQAMQIRLTGSSLIWNVRNGFGKVVERYVIPTGIAQPQPPNADHPFGYWRVSPDGMRYNAPFLLSGLIYSIGFEIDARDMQVVRLPHPMYKDDGYSPVSANAIWSDLAKGIDNSRISAMRNGMKPSYLVTLEQGQNSISDDEFQALIANLNNKYSDTQNSGKIMVVEGGKATVTKLSHAPDEMDYEKSHDQTRDDILANHRTPPIAVGLASPTGREGLYAPLEQYIFLTVQPLLNLMADEDNEYWVWQFGKGAYVAYTAKGIQDKDREGKEVDRLIRAKAIKKNEVRRLSGFEPWNDERGEEIAGESNQTKQQEKAEGFMPNTKSLKLLIEPEFAPLPKEPDTKYACVMLMLDRATGKFVRKMQSQIEPADVHEKGFENEPHITVLYGLLTDEPTDIVDKVGSFGPVEVTVGSSSLFESEEYDVLKLNVAGEQLVQLHEAVSELPYVKFHAKYQPHITLAYLKKGYGKKYVDKFRQLNGAVLKFAEYTFSDSNKSKTVGSLGNLAQSRKKAFCPTGEGGGIDNSCPPNRGGHESKDVKWEPQWRDKPTAEEFINARVKMLDRDPKLKPFLSEIEPADLKNHKLFLSKDGKVGVALSPEGDIQNVFNAGGPKGSGVEAVIAAINAGGITLDCFDGELPRYYSRFGFTETNRMKFNREFAPNGWDFETFGEPDVVFMALTNKVSEKDMRDAKTREAPERSTEYTDDWDGAKERSRDVSRAAAQGRQNGATD